MFWIWLVLLSLAQLSKNAAHHSHFSKSVKNVHDLSITNCLQMCTKAWHSLYCRFQIDVSSNINDGPPCLHKCAKIYFFSIIQFFLKSIPGIAKFSQSRPVFQILPGWLAQLYQDIDHPSHSSVHESYL